MLSSREIDSVEESYRARREEPNPPAPFPEGKGENARTTCRRTASVNERVSVTRPVTVAVHRVPILRVLPLPFREGGRGVRSASFRRLARQRLDLRRVEGPHRPVEHDELRPA